MHQKGVYEACKTLKDVFLMASSAHTTTARTGTGTPSGGSDLGPGWGVVAVVVVYVLMLYQLPLAPLLAYVLQPSDAAHAPCTSAVCHCRLGCTCGHHTAAHGAMDHADEGHAGHPSLRTCGTHGTAPPFVIPALDKALLFESDASEIHTRPPLTFAGSSRGVFHKPVHDIFHPPRRV